MKRNTLDTIPEQELHRALAWREILTPLLLVETGIEAAIAALAKQHGLTPGTIRARYYRYRKTGETALLDQRRCAAKRTAPGLPEPDQALVRTYCERNQRSSSTAITQLLRDWAAGKVIATAPYDPRTGTPKGWTKRNLMRYIPTKHELLATRIGTVAAASQRPLVYTSRADLTVGQYYLFDDMWHDHQVNNLDLGKRGRPLEFHCLDLKSACKIAYGLRVRLPREDGSHEGLRGADMRLLLAYILGHIGYNPTGTTLVVEHGTAAISAAIELLLRDFSNGAITVDRSGMTGAAAHAGQYAGRSKGNFRFKAALESLGNLIHNEFAALPGQVGKDRDHCPESNYRLEKHNDALLLALAQLPAGQRELLQFPLLTIQQFRSIADTIYALINSRTDHNLEGWDACYTYDPIRDRMRKLSPAEVWSSGKSQLITLPESCIARILGLDLATPRTVRGHQIQLKDSELSGDLLRFDATALNLTDRREYQTVLNPFNPDRLWIYDNEGRHLGTLPRIFSISRDDQESINRACGAASKREAILLEGVRARHQTEAKEKAAMHRHNADVLAGKAVTPEAKAAERTLNNRVKREGTPALEAMLEGEPCGRDAHAPFDETDLPEYFADALLGELNDPDHLFNQLF